MDKWEILKTALKSDIDLFGYLKMMEEGSPNPCWSDALNYVLILMDGIEDGVQYGGKTSEEFGKMEI